MAQTAADQEARQRRTVLVWKNPIFLLILSFVVGAVLLGLYRLARGEGESFAQDFFALCLDGIVFAGLVTYLEKRQTLEGRVRLKSHAISLLLSGLPNDERKGHSEKLFAKRRPNGVYELDPAALDPVLNAVCRSLGVENASTSYSGLGIEVLSGMLPVAAELSGAHLRAWGQIVENVKAYSALPKSPDAQRAVADLKTALKNFLNAEVLAP